MNKSKYVQLYEYFLKEIQNKSLVPGDKLPSEKEIMEKYNFSRDTVRKTLNLLVQEGYIEKARGKLATVIEKKQLNFPISKIKSFKELNSHLSTKTYVENFEIEKNNSEIMKKLNLESNEEYFKIIRIREIENEKIIVDKDFFNRKYVETLSLKAAQNSIYDFLENELNLKIGYCKKEITVRNATEEDYQLLDMGTYNMIVIVESFTYLESGELFQYTESRHRPDKFKFTGHAIREKEF